MVYTENVTLTGTTTSSDSPYTGGHVYVTTDSTLTTHSGEARWMSEDTIMPTTTASSTTGRIFVTSTPMSKHDFLQEYGDYQEPKIKNWKKEIENDKS